MLKNPVMSKYYKRAKYVGHPHASKLYLVIIHLFFCFISFPSMAFSVTKNAVLFIQFSNIISDFLLLINHLERCMKHDTILIRQMH
jgi:uncharacterized membrane protein